MWCKDWSVRLMFGSCKQKGCSLNKKITFASHNAWFGHYWRKGREVLIELVKENNISKNPYAEPTFVLAEKLTQISKIDSEYDKK